MSFKRSSVSLITLSAGLSLCFSPSVQANDSKETDLPEITVIGAQEGYKATNISTVGRTQLDASEQPRAIQVYSQQVLEDIQPASIEDIVTLAPNVMYLGDNDGRDNTFVIRGFQNSSLITDGVKFRETISSPELFNVQQVEVLKGADSLLYGAGNPGGLISLTSKRPKDEEHLELVLEGNSNGLISPKIDIGGSNGDGSVSYRLVSVYQNDPGWRDFNNDAERKFIAPSVTVDFNEQTSLTAFAEYTDDKNPNNMGTAIDNNGKPVAPLERINTHPDEVFTTDQTLVGLGLSHRFNEQWSADAQLRYIEGGYDFGTIWLPLGYNAPYYMRVPASQKNEYDETLVQLNLQGDIELAGMRHRISTGIDISDAFARTTGCYDPGSADMLDFDNPVYADKYKNACDTNELPNTLNYSGPGDSIERKGIFVQDAVSVTDQLTISGGLRFEDHKQTAGGGSYSYAADESILLPQLGAQLVINDQLAVFANYSESFEPATARDINGKLLDAEEGKGFDLGLKATLAGGKLNLTAVAFKVVKDNVAQPDPTNILASIASGEQDSKGLELDISGEVTSRLSLLASYGYLKTDDQGKELISAPAHTASLWGNYRVNNNWTLGGGFQYVGERFANSDNSVELDSYTLLNMSVAYELDNWKAQLNVHNLTDEEYIESAWGGTSRSVHPGDPRVATFSVSYSM